MRKVFLIALTAVAFMSTSVMAATESPERDPNETEPVVETTYVEAAPLVIDQESEDFVASPQTGEKTNLYVLAGAAVLMVLGGLCIKIKN